jgi:hypothetical protein
MEIVLTYILQVRNISAPTCFACVLSIFGWKKDSQYFICMDSLEL